MSLARLATASARAVSADPLAVLEVIDHLQVGPPVAEPDGLRAGYRIAGGDGEDEFELVVRFEQTVLAEATAPSFVPARIGSTSATASSSVWRRPASRPTAAASRELRH